MTEDKKEVKKFIGASLKSWIEANFENKVEVANILGVTPQYISGLCAGKTIGKEMAIKMRNHFGLSPSFLLTGEGSIVEKQMPQHAAPAPSPLDPNIEIINLQKKTIAALEQQIADLRESLADKNEIIYLLRQKISNLTYDAAFPNGYPSVAAESPNVSPQNPENAQTPD